MAIRIIVKLFNSIGIKCSMFTNDGTRTNLAR